MSDLKDFVTKNKIIPNKVTISPMVSSTGLNDPKIVEIITFCKMDYDLNVLSQCGFEEGKYDNEPVISAYYDFIDPHKEMEPGAISITGIKSGSGGKEFENSNFVKIYKKFLTNNNDTKFELLFLNNYAQNLINSELKNIGLTPLFIFDKKDMVYNFPFKSDSRVDILNLENLGMRFYYDVMPVFSAKEFEKNFSDVISNSYTYKPNELKDELLKKYSVELQERSLSRAEHLSNMCNIYESIKIDNLENNPNRYEIDNIPLDVFLFRRVGKKIIPNLERVDFRHLFSILSGADYQKGPAVISTLVETIKKTIAGNNMKEKIENLVNSAIEAGMINDLYDLKKGTLIPEAFKLNGCSLIKSDNNLDNEKKIRQTISSIREQGNTDLELR